MASFNQVILLGNLTRDVELKHTPSNQAVANIGLAMNRQYQTREGERREEVTFVDCEAWGRQAEVMAQYLSKGRPVFIQGRLKLDTWQDKDGGNRSKLKVVVENFQFVGGRDGGGGGAPAGGPSEGRREFQPSNTPANNSPSSGASGGGGGHAPVGEDDIPF
jgi:single-strand DNA-binding protein